MVLQSLIRLSSLLNISQYASSNKKTIYIIILTKKCMLMLKKKKAYLISTVHIKIQMHKFKEKQRVRYHQTICSTRKVELLISKFLGFYYKFQVTWYFIHYTNNIYLQQHTFLLLVPLQ